MTRFNEALKSWIVVNFFLSICLVLLLVVFDGLSTKDESTEFSSHFWIETIHEDVENTSEHIDGYQEECRGLIVLEVIIEEPVETSKESRGHPAE